MTIRQFAAALVGTAVLGFCGSANAAMLFDVTSVANVGTGSATASGTSNGIGWTMSQTYVADGGLAPVLNQTYTGFSNSTYFNPAVAATDRLHIFGTGLTLTFAQPISSIDFYLRENGGSSTLDFGTAWTLLRGR